MQMFRHVLGLGLGLGLATRTRKWLRLGPDTQVSIYDAIPNVVIKVQ